MFNLTRLFPKKQNDLLNVLFKKDNEFDFLDIKVKEEKDKIRLYADMPGFSKKDIDIEIIGNLLSISGQRSEKKEEKRKESYSYKESLRAFHESIALGEAVDIKKSQARYADGKLEVVLPKAKQTKKRTSTTLKIK